MILPTVYTGLNQLGYVTRDIEAARSAFERHYGVSDFFCFEARTEAVTPKGSVNELIVGLAYAGDIQIELIQPVGGDVAIYADVLRHSQALVAFHHVGVMIAGSLDAWNRHRQRFDAAHPVVLEGAVGDDIRFAFTDERPRLGHYIEHVWFSARQAAELEKSIPRF
ncbi:MAG: VOC family protein [Gammaproteobacteria bacterium]|nr:VOC family protein [Gammaproteobacteria bacterium]